MSRLFLLSLFVTSTLACGDDGSPSADDTGSGGPGSTSSTPMTVTEAASSTGDATSTSGTPATESSGAPGESSGESGTTAGEDDTGSTDTGSDATGTTGDESTGAAACTAIAFTDVNEPGFTGTAFCEGVQQNAVLADAQAVSDHNDQWCASVAGCSFPEPRCAPAPALPADGEQIVYVFGMDSGCSGIASIFEVLD